MTDKPDFKAMGEAFAAIWASPYPPSYAPGCAIAHATALQSAYEAGAAAERERCAGIADKKASEAHARKSARSVWRALACEEIAAAIRSQP